MEPVSAPNTAPNTAVVAPPVPVPVPDAWQEGIPLPRSNTSCASRLPKRKAKGAEWERLTVSYPWREPHQKFDAKWSAKTIEVLESWDCEGLEDVDIDPSNVIFEDAHTMVQSIIDEQLKKEGLDGLEGAQPVQRRGRARKQREKDAGAQTHKGGKAGKGPRTAVKWARAAKTSARAKNAASSSAPAAPAVQAQPGSPAASASAAAVPEERSALLVRKRLRPMVEAQLVEEAKIEVESKVSDSEAVPSLPRYKEVAVERWSKCIHLATARMLLDCPRYGSWHRHGRPNAVVGNPHKRFVNRIKARYGSEYPKTQLAEREVVAPDLDMVPASVARVPRDAVIYTVAVCDEKGRKNQEFDILADQTLCDLRDAFYFVTDWAYDGPSRVHSGCMYIDGIFYSDMRSEHSVDYAPQLIEYMQRGSSTALRDPRPRSMETRLADLERIPFGEKCIYVRQGDMEHLMYFTGARLFNFSCDCPFREGYPCLLYMPQFYRRHCVACQQTLACWVVHGSTRCPLDPAHFCNLCFRHFFRDKEGGWIKPSDYFVFPYFHD
ncbi:snRNA-activating protein complex subunit 3 (SNAPc subunit 3) (Small nuclear RNA-activating complex polypeptide 3) [Durusdinium trenchii]|uniref:snRNA-activating protein complex subunit 3 (SNAPc subunit 3) (Small nuclear RNA-activating complex polypeptide 3) n=1 Tax=Durusdinium trenchii TaxID=1381693 RepID=A0ABP0P0P9_9DINO